MNLSHFIKYLALGNSYTIGEAVKESERWPVQLAMRLREAGVEMAAPEIIAVSGWTTDELAAGIAQAHPPQDYDLVSLLIGVNNQYRGGDLAAYRREFRELLRQAIGFARGNPRRVIVLSIPDWGVTPFAANDPRRPAQISAEIDDFNTVNRQEAAQTGAHYIDITPISRLAAHDPTLIATDGLHPSGKMYAAWVKMMLPVILKLEIGD